MMNLLEKMRTWWSRYSVGNNMQKGISPYEGDSFEPSTAAMIDDPKDGDRTIGRNPNGDFVAAPNKLIVGPAECSYWLNGIYTQKFSNQKFFRYHYLIQGKNTQGVHTVTSSWVYINCSLENPSKRLKYVRGMIQRRQTEAKPIKFRYLKQNKPKNPALTHETVG